MMELNIRKDQWVKVKLLDVFLKKEENDKENARNRFDRFLKVEHMDAESLHIKRWASQENGDELNPYFYKIFRKGQILFPTRNPHLRRTVLASFDGICGEKTLTLEPNAKYVIPEFIPFLFHSESFYAHTTGAIIGSTNPHVRWRDVANYEFLLPPKDQQTQLAELLWAMDEVIEREREVLELNENLFLSFSKSIFSNGIGKKVELKKLGVLTMGQSPAGNTYNEDGNGMPFLQGNAEFGEKFPSFIKYTTAPNKIVPKNSILISVRAPVGDLNFADREYCIGRGLAGLFIDDEILRDYVFNFLKYSRYELEKNSTGSTFKAINKDTLSSLNCIIPDEITWKNNSQKLNSILRSIELFSEKIKSSKALQKSLINQIF